MKALDITGERYGKLIAICRSKNQNNKGAIWDFQCDCGNKISAKLAYVRKGRIKSCKCLLYETRKERPSKLIPHRFWKQFLNKSKRREIKIEITAQDIEDKIIEQNYKCALSGVDLYLPNDCNVRDSEYTISVDRIDSKIHYTKDNIQIVHKKVNMLKQQALDEELYYWCSKIYQNKNFSKPDKIKENIFLSNLYYNQH